MTDVFLCLAVASLYFQLGLALNVDGLNPERLSQVQPALFSRKLLEYCPTHSGQVQHFPGDVLANGILVTDELNQECARKACAAEGKVLLPRPPPNEESLVKYLLEQSIESVWVDAGETSSGTWQWADGTPIPKVRVNSGRCINPSVSTWTSLSYDALDCDFRSPSICVSA